MYCRLLSRLLSRLNRISTALYKFYTHRQLYKFYTRLKTPISRQMDKVLSFFVAIKTWHDECNNDCSQFIITTNQPNNTMSKDMHYQFKITSGVASWGGLQVRLSKTHDRLGNVIYSSEPINPVNNFDMKYERFYETETSWLSAVRRYTKKHKFTRAWSEHSI